MPDELDAAPLSLLDLFQSEREYHSPLFQRRYIWKPAHLDRLWKDIESILDGEDSIRFLGAIVLESRPKVLATEPTSYWIIDGQQRLTTLYMFLLNVAILAQANGDERTADDIIRVYLLNQAGKARNQPKIRPTLLDQIQFNAAVRELKDTDLSLPLDYGDDSRKLAIAFQNIRAHVRTYCRPDKKYDPDAVQRLLAALGSLRFVHIVIKDKAAINPNQVFDSLNTTGEDLENKDLIRNEVFKSLSENPQRAQNLYEQRWVPFEQRMGERLDGYFFPFTLIHDSSATKSSVLVTLRARWSGWSAEQIIDDLSTYVDAYDALTSPDPAARGVLKATPALHQAVTALNRLGGPASMLPFAVRVVGESLAGRLNERDATGCVRLIESFLVRRGFVGLEPTGLHVVFKGLWEKSKGSPTKALKAIEDLGTVSFPGDDVFAQSVRNDPLYRRKSILGYVLVEFELGLTGGDVLPSGTVVTADHIVPQKFTPGWGSVVSPEEHERVLHTWANLVPLSDKANAQKGCKDWSEARSLYKTEQYFKTTKRLAEQQDVWDAAAIASRAQELSKWALTRWTK